MALTAHTPRPAARAPAPGTTGDGGARSAALRPPVDLGRPGARRHRGHPAEPDRCAWPRRHPPALARGTSKDSLRKLRLRWGPDAHPADKPARPLRCAPAPALRVRCLGLRLASGDLLIRTASGCASSGGAPPDPPCPATSAFADARQGSSAPPVNPMAIRPRRERLTAAIAYWRVGSARNQRPLRRHEKGTRC